MCAVQASKDLKLSSAIFFLLTKKIDIKAQNLKLTYFVQKKLLGWRYFKLKILVIENARPIRYRKSCSCKSLLLLSFTPLRISVPALSIFC